MAVAFKASDRSDVPCNRRQASCHNPPLEQPGAKSKIYKTSGVLDDDFHISPMEHSTFGVACARSCFEFTDF